jgi:hypothetical protein
LLKKEKKKKVKIEIFVVFKKKKGTKEVKNRYIYIKRQLIINFGFCGLNKASSNSLFLKLSKQVIKNKH